MNDTRLDILTEQKTVASADGITLQDANKDKIALSDEQLEGVSGGFEWFPIPKIISRRN